MRSPIAPHPENFYLRKATMKGCIHHNNAFRHLRQKSNHGKNFRLTHRLLLFSQVELFNDILISAFAFAFQIIQKVAAFAHHFHQPQTRMRIFGMGIEVVDQVVDSDGPDRDLNFGRTGIIGIQAITSCFLSLVIDILIFLYFYRLKTRTGEIFLSSTRTIAINFPRHTAAASR